MKLVKPLNKWANSHFSLTMDSIRMLLGIFLFYKGIEFASGTEALVELIQLKNPTSAKLFVVHYVIMAHLAGGVLVFFGLLTRLSLLVQLPIFIGAVIINVENDVESVILAQSIFGLVASAVFVLYRSGRYSVDYRLKMQM